MEDTKLALYHLSLVGSRISLLKEEKDLQLTGILVTSGLQKYHSLKHTATVKTLL